MILLVKKDGCVEPYVDYEFINGNMLALYGENSYIVETEEIEEKLKNGMNFECKLPMLYSFEAHGALTNESFAKFGVPVSVKAFTDKNSEDDIKFLANTLRIDHKYDGAKN